MVTSANCPGLTYTPVMTLAPGHDGATPLFVPARGSRVVDASGRVVREESDGRQNVKTDRIAYLFYRGVIDQTQFGAGRRIQSAYELSVRASYVSIGGVSGGGRSSPGTLPDAITDSMRAVSLARRAIGENHWRMIDLVCLQSWPAIQAASMSRIARKMATLAMRAALDALAAHYGMIRVP